MSTSSTAAAYLPPTPGPNRIHIRTTGSGHRDMRLWMDHPPIPIPRSVASCAATVRVRLCSSWIRGKMGISFGILLVFFFFPNSVAILCEGRTTTANTPPFLFTLHLNKRGRNAPPLPMNAKGISRCRHHPYYRMSAPRM